MAVDFAALRRQLDGIDWGHGLTRDGIKKRFSGLPEEVYLHLPSEKEFRSSAELVAYAERAIEIADRMVIPAEGAAEDGGPEAWGDSPLETVVEVPDPYRGVGIGGDPGYTGGGSTQTGVGPEGTTYGDGTSRKNR